MRLATLIEDGEPVLACVREDRYLSLETTTSGGAVSPIRALTAEPAALERAAGFVAEVPATAWRSLAGATYAPAIPDPGAIYTIAANYRQPREADATRPERPRVLGKLPTAVTGHAATVRWDPAVTAGVDGECELGVVIGMGQVFGYTIVNDLNSTDPWLDGDQWLLGKSMAGFCPLGPWVVTADELEPGDLRLGSTINGRPLQEGRTSQMRFSIAEVIAYIGRHVELRPGDVIATGTPARLEGVDVAAGHLQPGDVMTCWIEGIGELTSTIG